MRRAIGILRFVAAEIAAVGQCVSRGVNREPRVRKETLSRARFAHRLMFRDALVRTVAR